MVAPQLGVKANNCPNFEQKIDVVYYMVYGLKCLKYVDYVILEQSLIGWRQEPADHVYPISSLLSSDLIIIILILVA